MNARKILPLPLLVLLLLVPSFSTEIQAPEISSYLTDKAGVFSPEVFSNLSNALYQIETETNGVQFVIFVEKTLPEGTTLEEYTLAIAERNKIGKKGSDNGILLYVATEDRLYRWEVGYGMEPTLPASLLGRISRDYMIPEFKAGNYQKGILTAAYLVDGILQNSTDPDIVAVRSGSDEKAAIADVIVIWAFLIVFSIVFLMMAAGSYKAAKIGKTDYFIRAATGLVLLGRLPGGSGGYGGFGRGGGGFSGGGGSFGGGGNSGGW